MGLHPTHTITLKTGETCIIRCAEVRDAQGVLETTLASLNGPDAEFNVTTPAEFDLTVEDEVRWIEEHRDHAGWIALVAEVDGAVIGLISFKNGPRKRLEHQGSFGMNVHPNWRGRGAGDALLGSLLDWARASPLVEKVGLAVVSSNHPARALYRKHGFVEEGRHVRAIKYAADRYDDNVIMYVLV